MISIDWAAKIIYIPKDFSTLVQSTPTEIRSLDLNILRLALKDLEDGEDGQIWPDTHRHNTEVSLSGITYARVIEIINDYTITFEDGQYAINLIGANSNVADRVNVNQVSVRSSNSAGMTSSPAIEYSSFAGHVTIDVNSLNTGTTYPMGTDIKPVNNLRDALLIAEYRGLNALHIKSSMTIAAGESIDGYVITSENDYEVELTIEAGASCINTSFEKLSIYGELSGMWNIFIDCWLFDVTNFCGWMQAGSFGSVELAPFNDFSSGQSFFDDIKPMYPNTASLLIMNDNVSVAFTGANDTFEIRGMTTGSLVSLGFRGGQLVVADSCTGGSIYVYGAGKVINNSAISIDTSQLTTGGETWDIALASHQKAGSSGKALSTASAGGVDIQALVDGVWNEPVASHAQEGTTGHTLSANATALDVLLDIQVGNWEIKNNQMSFYDTNGQKILTYNLFDAAGKPSMGEVFKRVLV